MTKTEIIQKIESACVRVLKQKDYTGAVVTSLTLVSERTAALAKEIAAAGDYIGADLLNRIYDESYECGIILSSLTYVPVVPAEDVATLKPQDDEDVELVKASDLAKRAAEELEKAAGEPVAKAVERIVTIGQALAVFKAAPDPEPADLTVPFIKAAKIAKLATAHAEKVRAQKAAAAQAEAAAKAVGADGETAIAKLDAIAKSASPAQPAAPAPHVWALDLNRK